MIFRNYLHFCITIIVTRIDVVLKGVLCLIGLRRLGEHKIEHNHLVRALSIMRV